MNFMDKGYSKCSPLFALIDPMIIMINWKIPRAIKSKIPTTIIMRIAEIII
jgi:hypothetical protein